MSNLLDQEMRSRLVTTGGLLVFDAWYNLPMNSGHRPQEHALSVGDVKDASIVPWHLFSASLHRPCPADHDRPCPADDDRLCPADDDRPCPAGHEVGIRIVM